MGTTNSADEFAQQFLKMGQALARKQAPAVHASTKIADAIFDRAAVKTAGPDKMFRNLGKSKAVLGTRIKFRESAGTVEGGVYATGPWGLAEYDVEKHTITPKLGRVTGKGAKRRRRERDLYIAFGGRSGYYAGKKPLALPTGPRYRAVHPGTKGKGYWRKAKPAAEKVAAEEIRKQLTRAVRFQ